MTRYQGISQLILIILVSCIWVGMLMAQNNADEFLENKTRLENSGSSNLNDSLSYYYNKLFSAENAKEKARLQSSLGFLHSLQGDYDSAIWYLNSALRLAGQENDTNVLTYIYLNYGTFYEIRNEYSLALKYYYKSLKLNGDKYPALKGATIQNIGNVFLGDRMYDSAAAYYKAALSIGYSIQDQSLINQVLVNLGTCYIRLEEYDKARKYLYKILAGPDPDEYVLLSVLSSLGVVYLNLSQNDSALYYFYKSKKLALQLNSNLNIENAYENLEETYTYLAQYDSAYYYLQLVSEMRDAHYTTEKEEVVSDLETQYQIRQKNDSLLLRQAQLGVRNSELDRVEAESKLILAGLLFVLFAGLGISFLVRHRIRARRIAAQQEEELNKQQILEIIKAKEVAAADAMMEGQEIERQRIADEIHDNLGSILATVKLRFEGLEPQLKAFNQEQFREYQAADNLLDQACSEVRKISYDMATGTLSEFGLIQAIEELVATVQESKQLEVRLIVNRQKQSLPRQLEVMVYRVVQELMSNIIKHANAKSVTISLNYNKEGLNLIVEDDGKGLILASALSKKGLGLHSIQERVENANGSFLIDSTLGNGTLVIIDIPLK